MVKVKVEHFKYAQEAIARANAGGLLLVSVGYDERPNVMTIGWGLIGTMWREPFFVAAVRASRHTHKLLEETGDFTVNVPREGMGEILQFCGTVSGRDRDKFAEMKLKSVPGLLVRAPSIAACPVHFECRTAFKVNVGPGSLPKDLQEAVYRSHDYHTLYFGRILGVYAEEGRISPFFLCQSF